MKLELGKIKITNLEFGDKTCVKDGVLSVNKEELKALLMEDEMIKDIKLDIAKPGDKTRIIPVKDVIEPRVKVTGDSKGKHFPGLIDSMELVGEGKTHVLDGAAVVTIGSIIGTQEGIIDMWGEGAKYTPFSKTLNLVVDITPVDEIEEHEHETAVREVGLKAAAYLGEFGKDIEPDETEVYELEPIADRIKKYPDLPKVTYLQMLITQGLLHDVYIYGVDAKQILPTFIHPNEILDGALVSGNCVAACDKITTYQHQNNSVVLDLYAKHGKEINFLGVVLTPEATTLEGKIRSCKYSTNIIKNIGADGVIVSEEGYGNPDADLMLNCKYLEDAGIKTVLITDECAGRDGLSASLADATPEAKAVVTSGNVSHLVKLPPAEKVLGDEELISGMSGGFSGSIQEDGSILCELNAIISSTIEIGYHNVTTKQY